MRLALFQPDIPQNTGTLLRLGACLDVPLDIIEPCGFIFNEKAMRRAGMDYLEMVSYRRHNSWADFFAISARASRRIWAYCFADNACKQTLYRIREKKKRYYPDG